MTYQPWLTVSPVGRLLSRKDSAAYLGMSVRTLDRNAKLGLLPKPQRLQGHGRALFIPKAYLDAVISANFAPETEQ